MAASSIRPSGQVRVQGHNYHLGVTRTRVVIGTRPPWPGRRSLAALWSTPGSPYADVMAIDVTSGDITQLQIDAVVNAANEHLQHGGGVAAAIARAGAPQVDDESTAWVREHGPVGPGEAAYTGAGAMPAHWVIHVVGPRYRLGQDNAALLTQTVDAALDRAVDLDCQSVALPAISAGIFGYPRDEATGVIATAVEAWLQRHPDVLDRVVLVGFDDATADAFRRGLTAP